MKKKLIITLIILLALISCILLYTYKKQEPIEPIPTVEPIVEETTEEIETATEEPETTTEEAMPTQVSADQGAVDDYLYDEIENAEAEVEAEEEYVPEQVIVEDTPTDDERTQEQIDADVQAVIDEIYRRRGIDPSTGQGGHIDAPPPEGGTPDNGVLPGSNFDPSAVPEHLHGAVIQ